MATKEEIPVLWGGAATKTLNTNNWVVSDEVTLNVSDFAALLVARADNASTPGSGDEVELRALYTVGDVDNGGGADDYPDVNTAGATASGAPLIGLLDTYNRYDPDWIQRPLNTSCKKFKIAARAKQGATRNITIAIRIGTHRGAIG